MMASRKNHMKLNPEDIRTTSEEDPLKLFHAANKSPATDKYYTCILRRILCDTLETVLHGTFEERVKEFVEIGRNDEKEMLDILLGLSRIMTERTKKDKSDDDYMNPSSIPVYFFPIQKLLDTSDVAVRWHRVKMTYPELDNVDDSRGWTLEEIRLMLDHARDARDRAIILVMASSGMRVGGMQLRWGDLTRVYNIGGMMTMEENLKEGMSGELACVAVRVYRKTSDKYIAFITPEAYRALMDYAIQWEKEVGRKPRGDDPIFMDRQKPQRMIGTNVIEKIVRYMASSAGVMKRQRDNPRRWEVPLLRGLRRFCNKTIKDAVTSESALSATIKSEFIIGHRGLVPLDFHYYKADIEEKAKTYVGAVQGLTISKSESSKLACSRNGNVLSELYKSDDRIIQLDGISMMERIGIIEGMCEYLRNGAFADSA